mmetsp:Transcript_1144/g.2394  ORF Transcript_1144/g.2394 Transcript_1144/m.2394 type:complete len:170 (-) Transcript_1144:253-762(-)
MPASSSRPGLKTTIIMPATVQDHHGGGIYAVCCPTTRNRVKCALIIGLLLFMSGCLWAGFNREKQMSWTPTIGTVVGTVHCDSDSETQTIEKPIISYTPINDERTYTFASNTCTSPPEEVGTDIAVWYDPDDPSKAMDARFASVWLFPILLGVIGLGVFVPSCFYLCKQ